MLLKDLFEQKRIAEFSPAEWLNLLKKTEKTTQDELGDVEYVMDRIRINIENVGDGSSLSDDEIKSIAEKVSVLSKR